MNTTDRSLISVLDQLIRGGGSGGTSAGIGSTAGDVTPADFASPTPLPVYTGPTGPATRRPSVAVIPLTRAPYIDVLTNRLGAIKVAGLDMTSEVSSSVTAAAMSFSSSQIGQFSMTVTDSDDAQLLTSGMFGPGTTLDWSDQHLEVRAIDFGSGGGGPEILVRARSRVISALKAPEQQGRASWGDMDVAQWVLDRCDEVGAIPVVQGGLGVLPMARQQQEGQIETSWDVMVAAARTVGALCYEFEQIVTFARPTWLAREDRARTWDLYWWSLSNCSPGLAGFPEYSWDADAATESLRFNLISGDADLARPGDKVNLAGSTGMATGAWMVTDVTVPLSITAAVQVTCGRITDPAPVAQMTSY